MPKNIIVALDGMSVARALNIAKKLSGKVWGFKVNDLLHDPTFRVKDLKKYGRVFADAKFNDIPNTVFNSVRMLSRQGVDMITIHASGGVEMMRAAKSAAGRSKIIAVTVLTSLNTNKQSVISLAREAEKAKLDGIVCSAHELTYLKNIRLLKIVPSIRPEWYGKKDDQKRKATPGEAIKAGADYLVIGRPITQSSDPLAALDKIIAEL